VNNRNATCSLWLVFGLAIPAILGSSDISVAQDRGAEENPPPLNDLLENTERFFAGWTSVSLSFDSERFFMPRGKPDSKWLPLAVGAHQHAWDDTLWRSESRTIATAYKRLGRNYHAQFRESVSVPEGVMNASYEVRNIPVDHFNAAGLEIFDTNLIDIEAYAHTGEEGLEARQSHKPSEYFLTGANAVTENGRVGILERFRNSRSVSVSRTRELNRDCWRISKPSDDGLGSLSMTVCPELDWGPVIIEEQLGPSDLMWRGTTRVGEETTDEGRPMRTLRQTQRLESIAGAWEEFTIRTETVDDDVDGAKSGFASVRKFHSIQRPAPESAFLMKTRIPEGTPVGLVGSSQLKAELRDGKVVRVYDGEAIKELATVHMVPAGPNWVRWSILALLTIAGGVWLWKWRSRNALLKMKPNIRRR